MDVRAVLPAVARQMRLDVLAVEASGVLMAAGIPHAVIKGPTTARWLYDPPRLYRDVDILVPPSRRADAVAALVAEGIAQVVGEAGEECAHAQPLLTPSGAEIDLHFTLPSMPSVAATGEGVWALLAAHLVPFDLDGHEVPALDVPGRCLVLAQHMIGAGYANPQVREDLRRARQAAGAEVWRETERRAHRLGISADLRAALAALDGDPSGAGASALTRLRLTGASSSAVRLEVLSGAGAAALPRLLWREAFPSVGFMHRAFPRLASSHSGLARAYVLRLVRLVPTAPRAVREVRAARRKRRVRISAANTGNDQPEAVQPSR